MGVASHGDFSLAMGTEGVSREGWDVQGNLIVKREHALTRYLGQETNAMNLASNLRAAGLFLVPKKGGGWNVQLTQYSQHEPVR